MIMRDTQETTHTAGAFTDSGSEADMGRLLDQDHLVTRELGLFPVPVEKLFPLRGEHVYRVLDLACGPGGWASALYNAFSYPW